ISAAQLCGHHHPHSGRTLLCPPPFSPSSAAAILAKSYRKTRGQPALVAICNCNEIQLSSLLSRCPGQDSGRLNHSRPPPPCPQGILLGRPRKTFARAPRIAAAGADHADGSLG